LEARYAVEALEFFREGVPIGGIEMVLAEEGGHPGKNPRMITRARASQASRSMGAGGSASNWAVSRESLWRED
jgi:hypothetical protein